MYNVLSSCDFPAYSASGVRGLINQFQLFCMCLAGLMIVNLKLPILADDPRPKEITNAVGMQLILIPNGKFIRLQRSTGEDWDGDERKHQVTITQDFYLGATEVTQAQYQTVMGSNPSFYQGDEVEGDSSQHPVGPANGTSRVYRGGSFNCGVSDSDPDIRLGYFPTLKNDTLGFRVAISPATAASKTPE